MGCENFDKFAKVYDRIFGSYKGDVEFYKREAAKAKGKVLEIGCGTGRIYLELLKEGVDIYGIDISREMLKVLKEKAKRLGLKPKVRRADMKKFKYPFRFSLIIIPFRSFLHNLTTQDQIKALENIRKHLSKRGKLILNFFLPHPEVILKEFGREIREGVVKTDTGKKLTIISRSRFINEADQLVEVTKILKDRNRVVWKGGFKIAFIYKREFELLLRVAGFRKWKVYGGFNYEPLTSFGQEMVWIIER